ncbi:MAG: ParB/RepB/Spo0J family partition protein [Thermodesulfobacteriota bacterium]
MKQLPELRLLAASAIDLTDKTYLLAPREEPPPQALVDSIRTYGILHPPLVQQRKDREFIVIAGRKRLAAALTLLRWEFVPCTVVPGSFSAPDLYALLLEHALPSPPLSPSEQSLLFTNLCATCETDAALPLLARLGYKENKHQLNELLALAKLTPDAMLALHQGFLNFSAAKKLLRFAPVDQEVLVALIRRFQLGGSKQQKLIDLSLELQRRRDQRVKEIIAPLLNDLATAEQQNIPQQGSALLAWLHQQCFPRSVMAENEFRRQVEQLHLPPTIQIAHSPSFEEDSLTLTIKLEDWDALRKRLKGIHALLDEQ